MLKIRHAIPAALALVAVPALAAPQITLEGDAKVERTVVQGGAPTKVLVAPQKVVPGDKLVFSTSYRNTGATAVDHFVVTNPLPKGVTYAADEAQPPEVSVDGGKSWGQLSALTVSDGKGGRRPAEAADVTHVRWTIAAIAPGATGSVSYHAVVR